MLKSKALAELNLTLPPIEEQREIVRFMDLAERERGLLLRMAREKKRLSTALFDTIIGRYKEEKR